MSKNSLIEYIGDYRAPKSLFGYLSLEDYAVAATKTPIALNMFNIGYEDPLVLTYKPKTVILTRDASDLRYIDGMTTDAHAALFQPINDISYNFMHELPMRDDEKELYMNMKRIATDNPGHRVSVKLRGPNRGRIYKLNKYQYSRIDYEKHKDK